MTTAFCLIGTRPLNIEFIKCNYVYSSHCRYYKENCAYMFTLPDNNKRVSLGDLRSFWMEFDIRVWVKYGLDLGQGLDI